MKKLLLLAIAIAVCCPLFAQGGKEGSDLELVQSRGTLVVGITDFAPMDYKDGSGTWIGFDADLAKAFAKSLGVEAVFVEIDWDNKLTELNTKNIDCIWNGMTLDEGVLVSMETSKAYMNNAQVVVVPKEKATKYGTADSIKGLRFAVESGSAGAAQLESLGIEYIGMQTQADALLEVSSGASDACVIDLLMACAMTGEGTSYPNLSYTVKLNDEEYGVGFRKGSDLAARLDDFLVSSFESGKTLEIAMKYDVQGALVSF